MPRWTTRSMAASRLLDMPTSVGDLTGRPSPARVTVRAVRMTLSNANSLNYLYLYSPVKQRFRPPGRVPCNSTEWRSVQLQTIPAREGHRFFKETSAPYGVTNQTSEMPFDQLDLKRAISGDERAMGRLWSQHSPHIDAVVRRLCGEPHAECSSQNKTHRKIGNRNRRRFSDDGDRH